MLPDMVFPQTWPWGVRMNLMPPEALFVIVFPFLYLTTSNAPMNLLPPTFRVIATYNPVTYIIEGVRSLVLGSWSDAAVWQGFVVAGLMFVLLVSFTMASFQRTLK